MHRFFIFNEQKEPTVKITPEKDLLHQAVRVLRIRENERFVCIYKNLELICKIDGDEFVVIESKEFTTNKNRSITLIQGIPMNKKVSLILQKATELDVDNIVLWQSKRSTSKLEDFSRKEERLMKIIIEACEQTRRNDIPSLSFINNLDEFDFKDKTTITLYENEINTSMKEVLTSRTNNDIVLIIGPEGGIEQFELDILVDKGSKIATLGKNILRTETASIAALSMVNYEVENG